MILDYVILADKATTTHDGKLVVFGGDIDSVTVSELPVMISASLVARLILEVGEATEGHNFSLECTSATGNRQVVLENRPINLTRRSEPDWPAHARLLLEIGFVVAHAGIHRFHLIVDGREMKTLNFRVSHVPQAEE
jgi:hypothetical protein